MITKGELRLLEEKERQLLELQKVYQENLPHIYGHKWYAWQRAFFNSRNRINLLTSANQVGKSASQHWKMIDWSVNKAIWPELWRRPPRQFWILYPTTDIILAEWETKILPDWMPRGLLKDDPQYGWEVDRTKREIYAVRWNSGVTWYFKTYSQQVHALQAGTCDAIFADEELIQELWDELCFRLQANDGYYHNVFTPTRNQLFWYQAMECIGTDQEKLKDAYKVNVSAYDCQVFDDGTPGLYNEAKIQRAIDNCRTPTEVQRRIFGRFVTEEGRLFPGFEPGRNMMPPREIPHDWHLHSGVDIGAGGGSNHPAAIVFLAVNPDCTEGEIFDGWRGDEEQTTAGDVFQKYTEMRGSRTMASEAYDSQSKDFGTISERAGESFQMAQKGQEIGYGILNTLLKTGRLRIHDTPELQKLAQEFMTVMAHTKKSSAKDDFADSARFACATAVPWDWTSIEKLDKVVEPEKPLTPLQQEIKDRRGDPDKKEAEGWAELEEEMAFWNDQY